MAQPNKSRLPQNVYERCKILPANNDIICAAEKLVDIDRTLSLRFLYLYCLGLDYVYFSRLLESIVGTNNKLLEFFEKNRLNPWTVSRYASELGISTRKLNFLFYEKFGMSAKQWLLEQRLKKGCELLLSTRLRVADIAMECGFSNHAHFSDSFRRRFQQCPSRMRTLME
ncbi:AraC family transcriptional regulator [Yersinia enterocolitica subsp. enterocolitica WA-314]|nr:AraC family transcriptional regulator [Yersinia enterocolitica subsp. enterocolitica WA-314]